ncbi:AAA domain family protein [Mycobacterium xenopi 3993]|nr:AAA domain family protein [Mycobacterium xenopi 3993]
MAEFLFGDDDALIQIDMGEFHDRFTASRLFGAPPGYVGYEEGGQLTEKVRRKPFSVVLFDEIEKAHQEIYNSLLQVLEDGRLTDGQGRTVDFKNTVLIFTSNLGTADISKPVGLGFSPGGGENNYERMKQKVNDELKKHFRPEFLNRIDDIIVFHQLTQEEIIRMVELMISRVAAQLKSKDMTLELTDKAKALLAKRGFDPVLGARPLRRTIQREIEDALSEKILFEEVGPARSSRSTWTTGTARVPVRTRYSRSPEPASRPSRSSRTWLRLARRARPGQHRRPSKPRTPVRATVYTCLRQHSLMGNGTW